MRSATTFGVNIETEFALRIFRPEIDFARGSVDAFGVDDEVMDQLLHLGQDSRFGRRIVFRVLDVDRPAWQRVEDLMEDTHGLPHFLHPHEIAVVRVTLGTDWHIEIVLFVAEIGLFFTKIVVDAASTEIRAAEAERDCLLFRDGADVFGAIDKDAVA